MVLTGIDRPIGLPIEIPALAADSSNLNGGSVEEDADYVYREPWYATLGQILIPFIMASMGTITAGVMLGKVENWTVYKEMNELFVLVPGLCGLKGNLDMCVAARLCTQSAMGNMRQKSDIRKIVIGNLAVVQVQAIVCSLFLVIFTVVLKSIIGRTLMVQNLLTLAASAIITASTSCIILDTMLLLIILFSQRYRFNPDYMATPIVASIGDVTSISLLSFTAGFLYEMDKSSSWVNILILGSYVAILLPLMVILVWHNVYTRPVLFYGWISVIGALCISEFSGFVLGSSAEQYRGFAVFSPIINGSGGNLGSVQANNMSSLLYQRSGVLGTLPEGTRICESPHRVLCYGTIYSRVSRIVIAISLPCNLMQVYLADYIYTLNSNVHIVFVAAFVLASLLQLLILLWTAHLLVHMLWYCKIDPDTSAIPFLTAFGDSLGTGLLAVMFYILHFTRYSYRTN
ncbi:solute carrier family 41 member 1-like [Drosophila novamexicana]|uniref:solute carrier family 41 member 1-like n=1 Tax=Drosophila novamexicana TaxID=47314 RepID=UPI0011E5B66E|nr:solute carrier family 41 member 1-like [Drosophila novamexicana]